MTTTTVVAAAPEAAVPKRLALRRFVRRFRANRAALIGAAFVLLLVLVAILAPVLAPADPNKQNLSETFLSPGSGHWLGTDDFGRDQLSRLIYGARVSLLAALIAVFVGTAVGVPLGMLAGYKPGGLDAVLGRFNDALMSVPALIFAMTVVAVFGRGLTVTMIAVGIIFIPRFFRISRAATQDVREETFIEASRALGCSSSRTVWRHLFPNVMLPLVVQVSLMLGAAVTVEASLSFLGLGVQPPTASWGSMLNSAAANMSRGPYLVYAPGIVIALTVLALTFVGDGVRDALGTRRIVGEAV
ncbi:MAG: ABC transporter permease [Ilumatobacteraceae bacterium]